MVFCSNRDGKEQIFLSNPLAEHPLKITDADANHYRPIFSPDDRYILDLSDRFNFGENWICGFMTVSMGFISRLPITAMYSRSAGFPIQKPWFTLQELIFWT